MHTEIHQNLIINTEGISTLNEMMYVVITLSTNFNDDLLKSNFQINSEYLMFNMSYIDQ